MKLIVTSPVPVEIDTQSNNILAAIIRRKGGISLSSSERLALCTAEAEARRLLAEMAWHGTGMGALKHDFY